MRRIGLAPLMALIAILALGLAAMKVANEVAFVATLTLTLFALMTATLGALVRRRRGAWIGFALFGWSFAIAAASPSVRDAMLNEPAVEEPATRLIEWLHPDPQSPAQPFPVIENPAGNIQTIGVVSGQQVWVDVTVAQRKQWDDYQAVRLVSSRAQQVRDWSIRIGLAMLGLSFATVGAVLGHLLDDRSTRPVEAFATSAADPPSEPERERG